MSGVILLPTKNRAKLLDQFFKSYIETNAEVEVWVMIDNEDLVNYETFDWEHTKNMAPQFKKVLTGSNVSMGDKCRWAYSELKERDIGWIGLLNDDHYCITPHWDKAVEKLLDGTNIVSTNDGSWNFGMRVVGLTAFSTALLDAAEIPIFPRNLQHLCIDDVWKAVGESTGCWLETMKINIEHRHAYRGMNAQDETFKQVNSQNQWLHDTKEFKDFMEQDFKEVCFRIAKLRSQNKKVYV